MHVTVEEEHITRNIPLSFQIQGDQDPHDYLDTPLCRIKVGLHRFPEKELDERFLSELALQFTIINTTWGALMSATMETSLEVQQSHWRILESKVIDEETCTWIARAKRVYPFLGAKQREEDIQILLVKGFQSLILEGAAGQSFRGLSLGGK